MRETERRQGLATQPPGFRDYADDTPRDAVDAAPPRDDETQLHLSAESAPPEFIVGRWDEDGFSPIDSPMDDLLPLLRAPAAGPRVEAGADQRRGRKGRLGTLVTAAAACAVGVGIGLGWVDVKERLVWPDRLAAAATSWPFRAPVAADRSPPEPAAGKGSAQSTQGPGPPTTAPQTALTRRSSPAGALAAEAPAARAAQPAATSTAPPVVGTAEFPSTSAANAHDASAVVASPATPPSDCANAGTLAGQLGCDDPVIAQAHRQMVRAYGRALDAGAPEEQLDADQARWKSLRARAAETSRDALLGAYQQRIQELEASGQSSPRSPN